MKAADPGGACDIIDCVIGGCDTNGGGIPAAFGWDAMGLNPDIDCNEDGAFIVEWTPADAAGGGGGNAPEGGMDMLACAACAALSCPCGKVPRGTRKEEPTESPGIDPGIVPEAIGGCARLPEVAKDCGIWGICCWEPGIDGIDGIAGIGPGCVNMPCCMEAVLPQGPV